MAVLNFDFGWSQAELSHNKMIDLLIKFLLKTETSLNLKTIPKLIVAQNILLMLDSMN